MTKLVRPVLLVVAAIQLFFAVVFYFQWPLAVNIWPFEGTTPLTYIFIASIFAAAGASTLWAILSGNDAAVAGIALDYIVIFAPMGFYVARLAVRDGNAGLTAYAISLAFGTLFGVWLLGWSLRASLDRSRLTPALVFWSFVFFVLALVVVGARLLLQTPNVIPWTITPELSVVIGCIFVGAAVYFLYGLLRPTWANAGGQLAGFLAYDIVLIVPFLQRLPTVAPEHRVGLYLYTAVVTYSGLLAIYYLFVHRRTRVRSTPTPTAA